MEGGARLAWRGAIGHGETAATRDILRNAEGAVAAIDAVERHSRITRAAGETARVAEAMRTAAETAAERSDRLRNDIDGLLAPPAQQA